MESGRFSSRPSQVGSRLFKTGSRHSRDNIFRINTSFRNIKRPTLLIFSLKDVLLCLTFLRISQAELLESRNLVQVSCWKKDLAKVYEHIKISAHEFTAANKKFWDHLLNSALRKAGQKSSHHFYLSHPGWKSLCMVSRQKSSRIITLFNQFFKSFIKRTKNFNKDFATLLARCG